MPSFASFRRPTLVLGALVLLVSPLPAQAPVVVRAAHMVEVESGRLVSPAVVVIDGNRITAVNPGRIPDGATIIDLGERSLVPGLMDVHTHLTGDLEGDWVHRDVEETAADAALRGAQNAKRTLLAGFTTVRDVGAPGFADIALMHAIDAGRVEGPSMIPAGHAIGITGGHCDITGYAPGIAETDYRDGVADGPDEAIKAVRYQIKHGAKVIKVCATAGVLSFEGTVGAQQMSAAELRAVVEEAARHGLKVAAHAHGSEGILAAVTAGVASIEHGSILTDEIIAVMKARGTYLVPTIYLTRVIPLDNLPPPIRAKAEAIIPRMRTSLRSAIAAGVKIALGTDAAVYPHGDNAKEFAEYVSLGMTPAAALRTATVNAADLLGLTDRGRIAAGLRADLIAVDGNPLEDVTVLQQVPFVMQGGRIVVRP